MIDYQNSEEETEMDDKTYEELGEYEAGIIAGAGAVVVLGASAVYLLQPEGFWEIPKHLYYFKGTLAAGLALTCWGGLTAFLCKLGTSIRESKKRRNELLSVPDPVKKE